MAELNKIVCQDAKGNNTGIADCFVNPKMIMGILLTSVGYKIAAADQTDLLSTLQAATLAAPGSRIYPLVNFVALQADNSEAPTKQTFGYGSSIILRDGNYDLTYQYTDGGLCLHKQLRSFNGKKWGAFLVDTDGVIYGYKNGDDLQAIPLNQFYAAPWKMSDGSNVTQFTVTINFKPQYVNEWVGFLATKDDFDIATAVTGLLNVAITEFTALAAGGTVKVQAIASCGGENLYGKFSAALALVGAWVATNASTGAAITVASVTKDDTNSAVQLTLTTTEGSGFPATGGKVNISLASPSALAALASPMSGYESNTLVETVPA